MKKDFITVSQNSGQGNASVSITADPNTLIPLQRIGPLTY